MKTFYRKINTNREQNKMNLLSKNSPVEQSIIKMKEVLKDVGCEA